MMANKYPKVFIIVLNYNGGRYISDCLNSLYKIDYPNFEIIVVDNASTDGSLEMICRQFSRCYFIKNEENLGFSIGNNLGIRYSLEKMADWILLLNPDTLARSDFLTKLIEAAISETRAGILSPVIMDAKDKIWFSGGRINWWKMKVVHSCHIKRTLPYETEIVSGCAMLIKSGLFKEIGLLDEDFFLYWEDIDLSVRARQSGYSLLVVPESRIIHLEKSEEKKAGKIYWLVISGLIFFKKNSNMFNRFWIKIYYQLRKYKNKKDLNNSKNKMAQAVKRAYDDFEKYVR
ncbi:MAG TPA: glycosyltransferase family 2 protein [Patescibacteria group bacterium]|nr:glycosyltransferase family 2 protein [Patescibacteria group bacterium]